MSTETETKTIKWSEVTYHHHGKAATVRTPKSFPKKAMWNGIIHCRTVGDIPVLTVGNENYMFKWWHEVEFR